MRKFVSDFDKSFMVKFWLVNRLPSFVRIFKIDLD